MVVVLQILQRNVLSEFHIPVEAKVGSRGNPVIDSDYSLDFLMIGSNSKAYQAKGCRQALIHVDFDRQILLLQKMLGDVETRRSGPNDSDS